MRPWRGGSREKRGPVGGSNGLVAGGTTPAAGSRGGDGGFLPPRDDVRRQGNILARRSFPFPVLRCAFDFFFLVIWADRDSFKCLERFHTLLSSLIDMWIRFLLLI